MYTPLSCSANAIGKLILEVENATPNREAFAFAPITDGLNTAGEYRLEYTLTPALPQHAPLTTAVHFTVKPGPAAAMSIQVRSCSAERCAV